MPRQENMTSERVELTGILAEFRTALEDEINQIKKNGQTSTLLYSGREIKSHGSDRWYRFNVEYAPALPADTPCKLTVGRDQFDVTVVSFEESSIILSSKVALPESIARARLENGSTVLLERLIKCIEDNAEKENSVGKLMMPCAEGVYNAKKLFDYNDLKLKEGNTENQKKAIEEALSNDITYIWGPPGTGKTTVIGQVVDELYKHNRSVLVVSHTNTAVDGAIKSASKTYDTEHNDCSESYPILRIGRSIKELDKRTALESHIQALGKDLYEKKAILERDRDAIQKRLTEIISLLAKGAWIKESELEQIEALLGKISELDRELRDVQHNVEAAEEAVQKEKTEHPECTEYRAITKAVKAKKEQYDTLLEKIRKEETTIEKLNFEVQCAQTEVRKHTVYAELSAREARFMTEPFLREELSKIGKTTFALNREIAEMVTKRAQAQQTIADYEKKGSVAKLFAGKTSVTQAQTYLENSSIRLPQAQEEVQRQKQLEQQYKTQLDELLLLKEQIRAVIPSITPAYWEMEAERRKKAILTAEENISRANEQKEVIYSELSALRHQQRNAEGAFQILEEREKRLRLLKELHAEKETMLDQANSHCVELLERELSLCARFSDIPEEQGMRTQYDALQILFAETKREVSDVSVKNLEDEKTKKEAELSEVFKQLNDLEQKLLELEKQAIMSAKIVGTTLAKSYLSDTLRARTFDTVILDEASMASIPALWCACYLAERSVVIVGDFLQLPPIVMAETPMAEKWLGEDIFSCSGMQERAKKDNVSPENFVMLNQQFRMEPDIAEIANMYYGEYSELHTQKGLQRKVEEDAFYSWYTGKRTRSNIHLVDTESLHAWVTGVPQGKSHSRLNCFSAAVAVDLAFKFLENKLNALDVQTAAPVQDPLVLIVAPYKPHIARVNNLIELEYRNRGFDRDLNYIRAGTIHSFQGSEADIVIFDLVLDEPHWRANLFLTDEEINKGLRKMFNVAVTRAKFKLYIVGNFAYCQKRAKNNALSQLLDWLIKGKRLSKIDAKELLPNITFSRETAFSLDGKLSGEHIVCREESFNDYFMADIVTFRSRLIIFSPFMAEDRLSKLLPAFTDAINKGKKIVVVTKALSDRKRTELSHYEKCEKVLRDIGVSILHKKGMHEKLIFVDDSAVWIGSLNALSFTGLTGEVMARHADKNLTAEYEKLFDIKHLCGAIENNYEQKCPICGNEMLVKESDEGGVYWQCVEGDYSRNVEQQYPLDGLLRCKCGAPYKFFMKNEPRWVCTEDAKHYQKMRESDLKLEKMAALIPTKTARRDVDRFFAQRRKERETNNSARH